jgi:hypothetical protein
MLDANTYRISSSSLEDDEAGAVEKEWYDLQSEAVKINSFLPAEEKDAFFQLVLHPIWAFTNLHSMYRNVALNKEAYKNKSSGVNQFADNVKYCYERDSLITLEYHQLKNGKWNHMMDQTHIGYTYWQQPPHQRMPEVKYLPADSIEEKIPGSVMELHTAENLIPKGSKGNIFYEREGYVSIAADHFTNAVNSNGIKWKVIPDLGRTGNAITTFPVTAPIQKITSTSAHLEYEVYTYSKDSLKINTYFSPTLNYYNTDEGLQYAISIDNEAPQITSMNKEDRNTGTGIWNKWVGENIIIKTSRHKISQPGKHIVKYWVVSPGVVLQKLVLDFGGLEPSYLGPPETRTIK